GERAYFIRNIHVNPTNICVNRCGFCAFSRSKGQKGAFELSIKDILRKITTASRGRRIKEAHIVGGLHPDWPFEHYLEMLSAIRGAFPWLHIKAFTATEVDYFQRISRLRLGDIFDLLKRHGLDSMPGGGAEIFDKAVRQRLCPEKISGQRWLEVMEAAHRAGIRTNATMLYGHVEGYAERVDHLIRLRELQDRAIQNKQGGFQAFIPLSYHPKNTLLGGHHSSGIDDLRTIAVSRLVLDNFDHIKAYWVMLGEKISQLALLFGADDMDGTVIDEKITYAAGKESRRGMTAEELTHLIRRAGKVPVERDSFYRPVKA
ncbi:MAG: aminofutalosine synthase MqnE, partial [Thermodesulfovibrionales bacterium]|nr:aminofutalosine synthase MqnE [Thermodesulfovibrionales bacterium]